MGMRLGRRKEEGSVGLASELPVFFLEAGITLGT
jgi:hypothetical protein